RRPIRRGFYQKMNSGRGFAAAELENSQRQLRQTVDRMETALAESDWLLGDLFSLADCCVGPLIDRMDDLGMADLWSDRPRFMEWLSRLRRRPSFGRAFYDGSRLSERSEFRDLVAESRESRRQEKSRACSKALEPPPRASVAAPLGGSRLPEHNPFERTHPGR